MEPGRLSALFSQFLTEVQRQKEDVARFVDFQAGSSSALSMSYDVWQDHVKSAFNEMAAKYAEAKEQKVSATVACNDLRQHVNLYSSAFSAADHWASEVRKNSAQLWQIAATLAEFLLESENGKRKIVAENQKLREDLVQKRNELATAKATINRQQDHLRQIAKTPVCVDETKRMIEALKRSVDIRNNAEHQQALEEIERLKTAMEQVKEEEKARREEDARQIEALQEKLRMKDDECGRVMRESEMRAKKIEGLQRAEERVKELEKAVKEHCHRNPFIGFDGHQFLYQIGSVPQESTLEFELNATRKQNKKLGEEVKALKTQIQSVDAKYCAELERTRSAAEATEKKLRDAFDAASAERSAAIDKVQRLEESGRVLEERIKRLNQRLQQQERRKEEVESIARYEKELIELSSAQKSGAQFGLSAMNFQALDFKAIAQESDGVLRQKVNELEQEKEILKRELLRAQRESEELTKCLEREQDAKRVPSAVIDGECKRLTQQLDEARSQVRMLQEEKAQISRLQEKLKSLEEERETLQAQFKQAVDETQKHKQTIEELHQQMDLQKSQNQVKVEPPEHHPEPEIDEPIAEESRIMPPVPEPEPSN